MKYILFVSLFLVVSYQGYSQNTFPSSGNVGIGTTPSHILTIKGSASSEDEIVNITNMTDQDLKIRLSAPGAVIKRTIIATATANRLSFGVGNSLNENLTIINGGNVGIGTTDPVAKLHVEVNSAVTDYSQLPGALLMRNTSTVEGSLNGLSFGDANRWGVAGIASQLKNPGSHTANLSFWTRKNGAAPTPQMILDENGNLSIGTTDPKGYKLAIAGKAVAEEMNVKLQANWPDYVFEKDYSLPSLESVQSYINQNKHLPEVPSAKEMEANGINLSEMNMLLLKKVEELTLYVLEQQKQIDELKEKANENK